MALGLEGRHVVITGGTGALGQAVVEAFVAAGAICHLPVREQRVTRSPAGAELTGGIDLADEAAVRTFFAGLPPLFASIHLAGGFKAAPITETTRGDLDGQLEINLVTTFLCCREAVRALRQSGGGRIVNVGSRAADLPGAGTVAYTASKGAVSALTRAIAVEVRDDGILVNAVLPSIIDTPANRAAMPNAKVERWPKPEEIARTILWLASPENRLTSGALIPVYGNA